MIFTVPFYIPSPEISATIFASSVNRIAVRVVYAIWLRTPMAVDLSEVIINAVMLAAVIKTRGNVVHIF
ncbi:phage holin family protein, partial [Escherichia coli]|uniref:phage holin family protein n=1 Tax=Escherichia coli TaxID=562 RepID=UPI003F518BFB